MVAAVAAAALACTPHPGLGTVTYVRGAKQHVLDLATCRETSSSIPRPGGGVRAPDGKRATVRIARGRQSIEVGGRALLSLPAWKPDGKNGSPGPIMLLGWSGDSRWVLYAIDPLGSQSLVADGVLLQAVSLAGANRRIVTMLANDDYRAWCAGRLVLTAGGDRVASRNKQLVVASPPAWRPSNLANDNRLAWGSIACLPGGGGVVAQSQRATGPNMGPIHDGWSLWRVGFDGSLRRLTAPPHGYGDHSPTFAGSILYFVRARRGTGSLYALRRGTLLGPLVSLGRTDGYYGHRAWPYSVRP